MLDHDETHLHDVGQLAECKAEQVLTDIARRDAVFESILALAARSGLSRCSAQARPDPRDPRRRGGHDQRPGDEQRPRRRGAVPRRAVRLHLDRQSREPGKRDGRDQAGRRTAPPGACPRGQGVLRRTFRQRAREQRQRHPDLQPADSRRRSGHGDGPTYDAVLHERRGGGPARPAVRRAGRAWGHLHARDGRGRVDSGPGPADDPVVRPAPGDGHPDPHHRARGSARSCTSSCTARASASSPPNTPPFFASTAPSPTEKEPTAWRTAWPSSRWRWLIGTRSAPGVSCSTWWPRTSERLLQPEPQRGRRSTLTE